jgi:hypothetical protein
MNSPSEPAVPEVRPIELGVTWAPNVSNSAFFAGVSDKAELWLLPYLDDPVQSWVVMRWIDFLAARLMPYNDESRHLHPLYDHGLSQVLWAAEAAHTPWLAEVRAAVHPANRQLLRHFLILLKEGTVEVVARGVEVERSPVPPAEGWMHRRLY